MARATNRKSAVVPEGGDETVILSAKLSFYFSTLDQYTTAEHGFEAAKDAVAAAAFDLLKPATTYDELIKTRDALKAAYIEKRAPSTEDEKTKAQNAANMLWSRTVARATAKGYKAPEVPQSDEAKVKQAKREQAKADRAKKAYDAAIAAGATPQVAKAMAEQATDGRKQKVTSSAKPVNTPADLSDDAIKVARMADAQDVDGTLFDALEWALANATHAAQLVTWVEAQIEATQRPRRAA